MIASAAAASRLVVAQAGLTGRFRRPADIPVRIAVDGPVAGWLPLRGLRRPRPTPSSHGARRGRTTCCSCTSPPARRPGRSSWPHTQQSYPAGHLSTMYWLGLRPGDVHLNSQLAGLGEACLVVPVRALERGGERARLPVRALQRARAARPARALRRHDLLRTADRMAHADPGARCRTGRSRCARWSSAGEPLNPEVIEQVRAAWGSDDPRWLRPDRDDSADRQPARSARQARLHGAAAAGLPGGAAGEPTAGGATKARSASTSPGARSA